MKNFIIGYGETLTSQVDLKRGGGEKKNPYSIDEARSRFVSKLSHVIDIIDNKPLSECADNNIVIKFIQHPSYLAKSYYPRKLFEYYGIRDVGSKSMKVKPDKWAVTKHPEEGLASCIYVSGTKTQYHKMLNDIQFADIPNSILKQIQTIESIEVFESVDKIKNIQHCGDSLTLEVILHASSGDVNIINDFLKYLTEIGGICNPNKIKSVGGLTFMPVELKLGLENKLANFSHLRVLRSMPKLRFSKPGVTREVIESVFEIPSNVPINEDIKVCIFDGGLIDCHQLQEWATEIVPDDVSSSHPELFAHGGEVCATYLFGPIDKNTSTFGLPYTKVDVVRVISPDDGDPDLFDVLSRIEYVLKQKKYKYINLSLGPQLPIDDDEVHVWTSVIDACLQDGSCLATVAIGNDGDLPGDGARIQPPSDMVNCLAIGSANSDQLEWKKATYSCIGPGRSPGLVKPDGLMFGGDHENLFHVYSPSSHRIVGTMGTSYAAPYALRVAAGIDAITDMYLEPSTVKALMVHNALNDKHDINHVGWGRMPKSPEQVIQCLDDEAIIVYQGQLHQSQHLRIPIPLPPDIDCTWVQLKATFCINVSTDPEHPLHYTKGGLDITFRASDLRYENNAEQPTAGTFFSNSKLYSTEEELRGDAYKWETCLSKSQKFKSSTLSNPMFDVKYHAREQGGEAKAGLDPLSYSLVVSIQTVGNNHLYNSILQSNQTLQAVKVINQIKV